MQFGAADGADEGDAPKASAQYQAPTPSTMAANAWPANLAVLVRPRLRWLRIFR